MKGLFVIALVSAASLLFGRVERVSAAMIFVANHSFETPSLPYGEHNGFIQDWSQSVTTFGSGVWNAASHIFDKTTLDGDQNAYLNGGSIAQQLTTGLVLGETYQLSALLGTGYTEDYLYGGSLELWAGGTVDEGNVNGGVLLGSLVVANSELVLGKFVPFQTYVVAPSSGSGLFGGELLSIRFVSNGRESEIDNIQLSTLSAEVPEPGSIVAMFSLAACGAASIIIRRRRARNVTM